MSELLSWVYGLVKLLVAACRICNFDFQQPQHALPWWPAHYIDATCQLRKKDSGQRIQFSSAVRLSMVSAGAGAEKCFIEHLADP